MTRVIPLSASAALLIGLGTSLMAQTAEQTVVPVAPAPVAAPLSPAVPAAPVAGDPPAAVPQAAAPEAPVAAPVTAPVAQPSDVAAPASPVAPQAPGAVAAEGSAAAEAAAGFAPGEEIREEHLRGRRGGNPHGRPQDVAPPLPAAHDMTPLGMYHQADRVVKSVMILLVVACFFTWTIFLFKLIEMAVAKARARKAARLLVRAPSLAAAVSDLGKRRDPGAFMAKAIADEYQRSEAAIDPAGADGLKERAVSIVARVDAQASARLRRGMGVLATVGSVSPFVGLFGTVWGIMNSFIGIAETQTTNLAVVAPGIAEALFATAIGLVAAIPAVVIYNHFTRGIAAYRLNLGDAGAAALRLLSRDIDFRHIGKA